MQSVMTEQAGGAIRRIAIFGTGLIGTSVGLALRKAGFAGAILGWDPDAQALAKAREMGAIDPASSSEGANDPFIQAAAANVIVLAGPVGGICEWLQKLAVVLSPGQLVTDVGSVKGYLLDEVGGLYNGENQPGYLPGHPMAGKERGGAELADAELFRDAAWLFTTPAAAGDKTISFEDVARHPLAAEWMGWVEKFGANVLLLGPYRHDRLCAAVSHLPQMLATALSSLLEAQLEQEFAHEAAAFRASGGKALREMTRLGASPWSMWRDIAITNEPAIGSMIHAMEQQLSHMRENLRTHELRTMWEQGNRFRENLPGR